jgi:TolB-like protein/Tfp pilus assembly protein PilF
MSLLRELKRRNVFRVGAAYVVLAWLLIQVSDTVLPRLQLPEWSVTLVIALLSLGFPVVLFFAWAFEYTPEGLKKEKDIDRSESITHMTGRKLDYVIIGMLLVAVSYFGIDRFVFEPARNAAQQRDHSDRLAAAVEEGRKAAATEQAAVAPNDKSIAVLPFVNMSDDAANEYFSDGISEELLNLLSKIPELRVISRSSAFSYKGKDLKLAQVAAELNVAHILEGSVRKAGQRVRITAQLIEASSDSHLWSETYDRQLDDIFAIQDEIAATVVEQLKVTLLGAVPQVQETDAKAYALYLQARHLGRQVTAEGFEQSIALYEQALAIDSEYADAWDGLAGNYVNQAAMGLLPVAEGYTMARAAVERALAIDPNHAAAHDSLGWIAMMHDHNLAQSARHFERALELDPGDPRIIGHAAELLISLGRLDEAIALEEYYVARDPVNPAGHGNLGLKYLYAGRWDEAIAVFQTALRLSPGRLVAHYGIGAALLMKGEAGAALAAMQQESLEDARLLGLAQVHHTLGDLAASDAALAVVIEKHEKDAAYYIAVVLAWRNEADRAFEWLDRAVAYSARGLSAIAVQPEFGNLHDDPRWLPFLESIGKAPAQLDAIEFKVTLPAPHSLNWHDGPLDVHVGGPRGQT